MMLQLAVNGDCSKADHPAVPVTAEELARDARDCLAACAQEAQGGAADAIPMVGEIHEILDRAGLRAPRLQHGNGALTWILIEDAACRGLDTRTGLEDSLYLPDGSRARGNAALVRPARDRGAGQPD